MKYLPLGLLAFVLAVASSASAQTPQTEITKWQDGRKAAVAITFDDSSTNQFRIGIPLLDERHLPATFFVITSDIAGSKYPPKFIGRPINEILDESAKIPTNKDNLYERTSVIDWLRDVQHVPGLGPQEGLVDPPKMIRANDFSVVDQLLAQLRATGQTYSSERAARGGGGGGGGGGNQAAAARGAAREGGAPTTRAGRAGGRATTRGARAAGGGGRAARGATSRPAPSPRFANLAPLRLDWDQLRKDAANGHEIANHSITHPEMPQLDAANILYEVDMTERELQEQIGNDATYSIEAPYGIDDPHVRDLLVNHYTLTRNWVSDADGKLMDGIMRDDSHDPTKGTHEYMEWERGPLSATTLKQMTGWVDTSIGHGIWLVLVIHGIDGIGWEPLTDQDLAAYLDYMKAKSDSGDLWVATYEDGSKYIRERMNCKVNTEQRANGQILVTITQTIDPRTYNLPLTARTSLPAGWNSVNFRQGDDVRTLTVIHDGDKNYVTYRMATNGVPAILTEGK